MMIKNLILSLTLIISANAWADGPSYQKPELIKQQLDECSDGLIHSWTYETDGYIFHGKNLDLECVEKINGVPPNDDPKDNFVFRDNHFWFFADDESYGSSVKETEYGVVVQHPMGNHTRNYIVNNFITAEKQEDIESLRIATGGYELYEDYYLAFGSKSYETNEGGAIWFDSKRNYKNEIIELLDIPSKVKWGIVCATPEDMIKNSGSTLERIEEAINPETGLATWWLAALTYHKKPEWCFSR